MIQKILNSKDLKNYKKIWVNIVSFNIKEVVSFW